MMLSSCRTSALLKHLSVPNVTSDMKLTKICSTEVFPSRYAALIILHSEERTDLFLPGGFTVHSTCCVYDYVCDSKLDLISTWTLKYWTPHNSKNAPHIHHVLPNGTQMKTLYESGLSSHRSSVYLLVWSRLITDIKSDSVFQTLMII